MTARSPSCTGRGAPAAARSVTKSGGYAPAPLGPAEAQGRVDVGRAVAGRADRGEVEGDPALPPPLVAEHADGQSVPEQQVVDRAAGADGVPDAGCVPPGQV